MQADDEMALIKNFGKACVTCGKEIDKYNCAIFDLHCLNNKKEDCVINPNKDSLKSIRRGDQKYVVMCSNCHRVYHQLIDKHGKD